MYLMIDNYDSFTYNIVQYLGELGVAVVTRRNDDISAEEIERYCVDALFISPGPCDPDKSGVSMAALAVAERKNIPVLGVCLGFECIGQYFGGKIVRAPTLMHGKVSEIHHKGGWLFEGISSPFNGTRYHSLMLSKKDFPSDLEITAFSDDGVIMGLRHATLPIHGVQFHPESVLTENGRQILNNFINLSKSHNRLKNSELPRPSQQA